MNHVMHTLSLNNERDSMIGAISHFIFHTALNRKSILRVASGPDPFVEDILLSYIDFP